MQHLVHRLGEALNLTRHGNAGRGRWKGRGDGRRIGRSKRHAANQGLRHTPLVSATE
mgnify:FL=1